MPNLTFSEVTLRVSQAYSSPVFLVFLVILVVHFSD